MIATRLDADYRSFTKSVDGRPSAAFLVRNNGSLAWCTGVGNGTEKEGDAVGEFFRFVAANDTGRNA